MKYLLFIIMLCTSILCCKKDEIPYPLSELPPATQKGASTMGCLIDGVPWISRYDSITILSADLLYSVYDDMNGYNNDDQLYFISGFHFDKKLKSTTIDFGIRPFTNPGQFDNSSKMVLAASSYQKNGFYNLDTLLPYKINITHIDRKKRIVSGLFEFYLVKEITKDDTLHVTDGRFDEGPYNLE